MSSPVGQVRVSKSVISRARWLAILMVATMMGLALPTGAASAATNGTLYLSPATKTVAVGAEVDVQIRLNTGTHAVNAVQANFTYSPTKFKVLGFDSTASAFSISAQATSSNGIIQVARAAFTSITGDVNVTTVRFQAIATGTADVCPQDQSLAIDPGPGTAIPWTKTGGTFTVGTAITFGVSCISHDWISRGTSHTITIKGRGFSTSGAKFAVSGTGVSASSTTVASGSSMTTTIKVSTTAATGFRDITVTSGGKSYVCRSCLAVGEGPQVTSTTPATVQHGVSGQTVAILGQYLGQQTIVAISGMTVTSQKWISYQEIDATVTVPAITSVGPKTVWLYDPYSDSYGYYGRGSCSTCISVN